MATTNSDHFQFAFGMKLASFFFTLLLVIVIWGNCLGQVSPKSAQPNSSKKNPSQVTSKLKCMEAISLLRSLATETPGFDAQIRFRIQSQIAGILWNYDKSFARSLFLKAWESAEAIDNTTRELAEINSVTSRDARRQVIQLAVQRDAFLAEELLARMAEKDEEKAEQANGSTESTAANSLSAADLDRFSVAGQLLADGKPDRAIEFLGGTLNRVVIPTLRFLSQLRGKDAAAADRLYLSLLSRVLEDPTSDANTVLLLSSYIFNPDLYVRIGNNGFPIFVQTGLGNSAGEPAAAVRSAFLNSAIQILLRPTPDITAQRINYMAGTRLLPAFERFNTNMAALIRVRLAELSASISANLKTPDVVNKLQQAIDAKGDNQSIQDILNKAAELPNSSARDRLYIQAAVLLAKHGDSRAKEIAEEISTEDLREKVRVFVIMALANSALNKNHTQTALDFARSENLGAIERLWIYLKLADLLGKKRTEDAIQVIFEALPIVRRMDRSANKARAMVAIAVLLIKFKPELSRPYVTEAIAAINNADPFDVENPVVEVLLKTPVGDWRSSYAIESFALTNLFSELGKQDFFEAINNANSLKGNGARSFAVTAVAQSALDQRESSLCKTSG